MANENKINWTLVVLGTIICIGLYLIPSPLQSTRRVVVHTHDSTWVVLGTADTSRNDVPKISGHSATISIANSAIRDSSTTPADYYFYGEVKEKTTEGDSIFIQSYTYPYEENDTIKAQVIIDYDIFPRPIVDISRVDTVYKMNPVEEVPFYEKPLFVAPTTVAATLTFVYIVSRLFK